MSPVSWTRLGRRNKHQGPCTPQGKTQLSIPWTTVCMLTIEQPSTSSSGKEEHAHLCVCVSHDSKSFPALHLIPHQQLSRCLFPRRRWDTTASLNQTNLPCQLIPATNFCSVATIHLPILSTWLAGIVLQGEHSLAQQKVVLGAQRVGEAWTKDE